MNSKPIKTCSILSLMLFLSCSSILGATPSQVVNSYCQLDLDGSRLSIKSLSQIDGLMVDGERHVEPGWDTFKIISGYKILKETFTGKNNAYVSVKYYIIATIDTSPTLQEEKQAEVVKFKLIKNNNTWKISDYIDYPRISKDAALRLLKDWRLNVREKEQLTKIDFIIAKIKILGSAKGRAWGQVLRFACKMENTDGKSAFGFYSSPRYFLICLARESSISECHGTGCF